MIKEKVISLLKEVSAILISGIDAFYKNFVNIFLANLISLIVSAVIGFIGLVLLGIITGLALFGYLSFGTTIVLPEIIGYIGIAVAALLLLIIGIALMIAVTAISFSLIFYFNTVLQGNAEKVTKELLISYKEIFKKQIPNAVKYLGFSVLLILVIAAIFGLTFVLMIYNALLGIGIGILLFALFMILIPIFTFSIQYELAVSNRSLTASIRRSVELGRKNFFLIVVYMLVIMVIGFVYGLLTQVLFVFPLCILLPLVYLVQFLVLTPFFLILSMALWQRIKDS